MYTCSAGRYCANRYKAEMRKSINEIAEDCKRDSRCKAFDYMDYDKLAHELINNQVLHGPSFPSGHLCSTTDTRPRLAPKPDLHQIARYAHSYVLQNYKTCKRRK